MDMVRVKPGHIDFAEAESVNCHTDRINELIKVLKNSEEHICSERSRLVTESWKETEGEPLDIRRAKLFRKVMRENPIAIWDNELIVGSQSKYMFGASPYVDYNPAVAVENLKESGGTGSSSVKDALISEEERQSLEEDVHYWQGRSTGDAVHQIERSRFPWLCDWEESGLVNAGTTGNPPAVRSVDYGKVIRVGLEGIIAEAKAELNTLEYLEHPAEDYKKECFLQAVIIALEGAIEYAGRYASLAVEMAGREQNAARKAELERIAKTCSHVPAKPARDFYEAVQSFWLIHICVNLETSFLAESPSRMDQYLYPLYLKDVMEDKTLSRQAAAEILSCLMVKFNQMACVKMSYDKKNIPGTHLQDVTICGVDRDGWDASNELSYLLLEVIGQTELPQPPIYVRYHNKINREIWLKALEVNVRRGDGNPALLNDETRIFSLVDHDIPLQDAREWAAAGCAGSIVPAVAIHGGSMGINYINLAKIFEYVLNDGRDPKNGKQIGLHTGDPRSLTSIDQFIDAFKQQFDYLIGMLAKMARLIAHVDATHYHIPFCSALVGDCIKKGMDAREGGVRYPQFLYHVSDRGLQDTVDSLIAINKLVFEDKKLSIGDILDALAVNFEGKERIRSMLHNAPKYGNDDDYVDELFSDLSIWLQNRIAQELNPFGSKLWSGRSGAVAHVSFGKETGALPNGRKAWQPLADGFLSPSQGVDTKGPTAVFNSASKVNHVENSTGALMNMKFERRLFKDVSKLPILSSMIESFFQRGGFHIQINFLEPEVLLKAQENPEKYANLMVRVAGYSAFFVDLPRQVQDEILARTSQAI